MSAPDFIVNSYILSSIFAYMSTFFKVLDEASAKNSDELHLKADTSYKNTRHGVVYLNDKSKRHNSGKLLPKGLAQRQPEAEVLPESSMTKK